MHRLAARGRDPHQVPQLNAGLLVLDDVRLHRGDVVLPHACSPDQHSPWDVLFNEMKRVAIGGSAATAAIRSNPVRLHTVLLIPEHEGRAHGVRVGTAGFSGQRA
jgi:hypothetical protein